MSRRRWGVAAVALMVAVTGVVLAQLNDLPVGRETVARFLQVEPSSLQFSGVVEAPQAQGAHAIRELWLLREADRERPVRVWVERARNYVMSAQWEEGAPPEGNAAVSEEDALATAREYATRVWNDLGPPASTQGPYGAGDRAPQYVFRWERVAESGADALILVNVSAVNGQIQRYMAVMLTPNPSANQPVRLTPADAEARARKVAEARAGYTVDKVDVRRLDTTPSFAPEGEPVYPVFVEATFLPPGGGRACTAKHYWEVQAATGDVFIGPGQVADDGAVE